MRKSSVSTRESVPTEISGALSVIVATATTIQNEMLEHLDTDWVAKSGPRVPAVRDGMVYLYRAWSTLLHSVSQRHGNLVIAQHMLELAGCAMKIGLDVSHILSAEHMAMMSEPLERMDEELEV